MEPINKIWTEKYRPKKVSEMVGEFKDRILKYLDNPDEIPHFLLYSKCPGTGKCLTKDEMFFTKKGLISFDDYCKENNIVEEKTDKKELIYDVENNKFVQTEYFYKSNDDVIKIKTKKGFEIKGTKEHKIKVFDLNKGIIWKKLSEINHDNVIPIFYNTNIFGNCDNINWEGFDKLKEKNDSSSINIKKPESLNNDISYFLGVLVANGLFDGNGGVRISTHKDWLQKKLLKIVENNFNIKGRIRNYKGFNEGVDFSSVWLSRFLSYICKCSTNTARTKYIPNIIFSCSKEIQLNFINGLLEDSWISDLGYIEYCTASKQLAKEFQLLMLNLGYVVKKSEKYLEEYNHTYYTLLLSVEHSKDFLENFDYMYKNRKIKFKDNMNTNFLTYGEKIKQYVQNIRKQNNISKHTIYENNFIKLRGFSGSISKVKSNLDEALKEEYLRETIKIFCENDIFLDEVIEIENLEKQDIYDFHIPNTHQFLASGIINHNTTLAKAIIKEFGCDALYINSSDDRKIETIREKVKLFAMTQSSKIDKKRCVFLDEADGMWGSTKGSQEALRNIMETYSSNVFFILTCVDKNTKIYLPSGFKRVQDIKINDNILTMNKILENKNVIKRENNKLLKIKTLHGQEINITPEHKFNIKNNWIEAKNLKLGDNIDIKLNSIYGRNIELDNNYYNVFNDDFIIKFKKYLLEKGLFTKEIIFDINKLYKKSLLPQHFNLLDKMESNKEYTIFDIMKLDNNELKKHRYNNLISILKKLNIIKTVGNNRNTKYVKIKNVDEVFSFYDLVHYINDKYKTNYNVKQIYNIYRNQNHVKLIDKVIIELENVLNINSLDYDKIESFGRLLGFMFGDGYVSQGSIQCAGNKDALLLVKQDVLKLFPKKDIKIIKNGYEDGNGYAFKYSLKSVYLLFEFLGVPINGKVGQCMHIPKICYKNKLLMKSFIQALFDCESLRLVIGKNNKGVEQLRFGQKNIISLHGKDTFFKELVSVLKKQFNIEGYDKYDYELFDNYKRIKERRMCKTININKQSEILKFMTNIGNYYEEYKIKYDLFGYLLYKKNQIGTYNFLSFDDWKNKYYDNGILNDEIINIQEYEGAFEVYDLSLDEEHSYISNGFISHNCNNINKIIEPIQSRCVAITFAYPKKEEIESYLAMICKTENLKYTQEGLKEIIEKNYPSIRNCVLTLQDMKTLEVEITPENVKPVNEIFDVLWEKFKAKDWVAIKTEVLQSTIEPRELNTFFWNKALDEEPINLKLIQICCRNEKDIAWGADAKIIFATSIIEMCK